MDDDSGIPPDFPGGEGDANGLEFDDESKGEAVELAGLLHGLGRRVGKENKSDIGEIYNPKRFTPVANRLGIRR